MRLLGSGVLVGPIGIRAAGECVGLVMYGIPGGAASVIAAAVVAGLGGAVVAVTADAAASAMGVAVAVMYVIVFAIEAVFGISGLVKLLQLGLCSAKASVAV